MILIPPKYNIPSEGKNTCERCGEDYPYHKYPCIAKSSEPLQADMKKTPTERRLAGEKSDFELYCEQHPLTNNMNTITIQKSNGKYDEKKAKKLFSYIDSDLKNYHCDSNDAATPKTTVEYRKLERDGTFIDMFGTKPKSFTKAQIMDIIENHSEVMNKDGYANFFPYVNEKGERFVLPVRRYDSEWELHVSELEGGRVWDAEYGRVIFLPQQDTVSLEPSDSSVLEPFDPSELFGNLEGHDDIAINYLKSKGYSIRKEF